MEGFSPDLLSSLTLFGNRISPFSHRAYWALLEKKAAGLVDYVHIDLNNVKPEWFKVCVGRCSLATPDAHVCYVREPRCRLV